MYWWSVVYFETNICTFNSTSYIYSFSCAFLSTFNNSTYLYSISSTFLSTFSFSFLCTFNTWHMVASREQFILVHPLLMVPSSLLQVVISCIPPAIVDLHGCLEKAIDSGILLHPLLMVPSFLLQRIFVSCIPPAIVELHGCLEKAIEIGIVLHHLLMVPSFLL